MAEDEELYMDPEYSRYRPHARVVSAILFGFAAVILVIGLLGFLRLFTLWAVLLAVLAVAIWFMADRPVRRTAAP
ncbi:MAG: hypothetical protein ACNA8W_24345 [Bradymonadaceae bacterium]